MTYWDRQIICKMFHFLMRGLLIIIDIHWQRPGAGIELEQAYKEIEPELYRWSSQRGKDE